MKAYITNENNLITDIIKIKSEEDAALFNATVCDHPYYQINKTLDECQSDKDQAEIDNAREHRNDLLKETDWWAVSDLTMTQEQIDYRQALRDLPAQEGFPNIDFPEKP